MAELRELFQNLIYSIPKIGISDVVDILVVAFLIYSVLRLIRSTSAARVARAILLLLIVTALTDIAHLYSVNWILNKILELGVLAIVILFQPELRRALERVGGRFKLIPTGLSPSAGIDESVIAQTVNACEEMSRDRIGVLLVFERETPLDEYFKTGTIVDAKLTEQLLKNLFFPKAMLHDGAVIVRGGRVAAAGCVMPLSENTHLPSDLGTRHRAGVGTSEVSDAVVIIVSEETGTISVAIGGMLKRHLAPQTLEKLLTNELLAKPETDRSIIRKLKSQLSKRQRSNEEK